MSASRLRVAALAMARQQRPRRPQPWALECSPATAAATTAARSLHSTTTSTAPATASSSSQPSPSSPPPLSSASDVSPAPLGRSLRGPAFFSSTPRSSWPNSSSHPVSQQQQQVSDEEFQLRVGRAIDLLRATMPEFLRTGLSDYDSAQDAGERPPGRSRAGLHFDLAALLHGGHSNGAPPAHHQHSSSHSGSSHSDSHLVPVYHPAIKFCVKAMGSSGSTPDSDPDSTPGVSFSGRTLYHGSAHVLRHALAALFYDARVALESVQLVRGPYDCGGSSSSSSSPGAHASRPAGNMPFSPAPTSLSAGNASRNLSLLLRLKFEGSLRVTGAQHTYHLLFRYDFDPASGQICRHIVERIEPALGRKLWAGLSTAFLRLAGLNHATTGLDQPQPAAAARSYLSASMAGKPGGRGTRSGQAASEMEEEESASGARTSPSQDGGSPFLSPQPCLAPAILPPPLRRRMPMTRGRAALLRGQYRELSTCAVRSEEAKHAEDDKARRTLSEEGQGKRTSAHEREHEHHVSAERSVTAEEIVDEEAYKAALLKARLSLTFTCTVTDCGHRSTHEFSRHSYERGIVIVQCPGCKNRHLIADHLSWFTETADEPRTIEQMVAAKGGQVRRGVAYSDQGTGETVEIVLDEEELAGKV